MSEAGVMLRSMRFDISDSEVFRHLRTYGLRVPDEISGGVLAFDPVEVLAFKEGEAKAEWLVVGRTQGGLVVATASSTVEPGSRGVLEVSDLAVDWYPADAIERIGLANVRLSDHRFNEGRYVDIQATWVISVRGREEAIKLRRDPDYREESGATDEFVRKLRAERANGSGNASAG